jgi:hypothetical protein
MQNVTFQRLVKGAALPALVVALGSALVVAQGLSGAVFTTDAAGTFVNGNVYDAATEPYLNGGPRANAVCTAAGLPSGDYYFQVTDPSGHTLLSEDDVETRRVTVWAGHIVAHSGSHSTGTGRCGDVTVQLFPFLETPNEGGEYKVWMTPVAAFRPGEGAHGFLPKNSKTDNFKVTLAPAPLDSDGDGILDGDDNCPLQYDPTNVCATPPD